MPTRRLPLLLALAASLGAGTASAADMYPVYGGMIAAPELTPVEVGNGWYLRGDVSYEFDNDVDGTQTLFTPFTSVSGSYDELELRDGFNGGIGIGYRFNDFLRADVTGRYGKSDIEGFTDLSGGCVFGLECDFSETASTKTWEVMANAYADLGTFAGFTPYVGAGAGAVQVSYEDATGTYCDSALVPADPLPLPGCISGGLSGDDSWRFAWQLSAGLAYAVSRSLTLDVGYRYLNVEGGDAYGLSLDEVGLPGSGYRASDDGFDRHTIQAGLRYSLW